MTSPQHTNPSPRTVRVVMVIEPSNGDPNIVVVVNRATVNIEHIYNDSETTFRTPQESATITVTAEQHTDTAEEMYQAWVSGTDAITAAVAQFIEERKNH